MEELLDRLGLDRMKKDIQAADSFRDVVVDQGGDSRLETVKCELSSGKLGFAVCQGYRSSREVL